MINQTVLNLEFLVNQTFINQTDFIANQTLIYPTHITTSTLVIILIDLVISLIATVTNTVSFVVFMRSRPRSVSAMTQMLLFLSVAEIILSISTGANEFIRLIYQTCINNHSEYRYFEYLILLFSDARFVSLIVRNLWVAFIAVRRWDATSHPMRPIFRSFGFMRLAGVMCGLYFICTGCLSFFYIKPKKTKEDGLMYFLCFTLVSNGFTFGLIAVCGALTVAKSRGAIRAGTANAATRKRQLAVTKTILTLLAAFLIFEVTFLCIHTIYYINAALGWHVPIFNDVELFLVGYILTNVDSVANFFIYCLCYATFRHQIVRCCCCCTDSSHRSDLDNTSVVGKIECTNLASNGSLKRMDSTKRGDMQTSVELPLLSNELKSRYQSLVLEERKNFEESPCVEALL